MNTDVITFWPLTQVSSLKKSIEDTHLEEFILERIRRGGNGRILSAFKTQSCEEASSYLGFNFESSLKSYISSSHYQWITLSAERGNEEFDSVACW